VTLLPPQHPTRSARYSHGAKSHEYCRRYRGEGRNEAGGEFRLPAPDCVEGKPRIAMSERFDIPKTGDVDVRYGERFGKNCAISIHNDDPQCIEIARSSHSLTRGLANDFSGENRHGVRTVNARGVAA
jgi:hypothetical protein